MTGYGKPIQPRRLPPFVSVTKTPRFSPKTGETVNEAFGRFATACSMAARAERTARAPSSSVSKCMALFPLLLTDVACHTFNNLSKPFVFVGRKTAGAVLIISHVPVLYERERA